MLRASWRSQHPIQFSTHKMNAPEIYRIPAPTLHPAPELFKPLNSLCLWLRLVPAAATVATQSHAPLPRSSLQPRCPIGQQPSCPSLSLDHGPGPASAVIQGSLSPHRTLRTQVTHWPDWSCSLSTTSHHETQA